jgi:hypothetical protein
MRPCDRMSRKCGPVNGKTPGMLRGLSFRSGPKRNGTTRRRPKKVGRKWARVAGRRIYFAATSSALSGAVMVSLMTWIK